MRNLIKTISKIFITCVVLCVFIPLNAQLRVLSSGRIEGDNQFVISSDLYNDMLDIVNTRSGVGAGYDLIWANYANAQFFNPGLLKLSNQSIAKFVVKANGYVGICKTSPTCELDLIGEARINGDLILTSDERLKENIVSIDNAKTRLLKLTGKQYNLKATTEDKYFETIGTLNEKDSIIVKKNIYDEGFYNRKRLGFLAQDVKKLFPELVFEDSLGILSINYIGLMPVIVETIKQQENKITELESRVTQLESVINNTTKKSASNLSDPESDDGPILYQNSPNPFYTETKIKYFLPESTQSATLYIFNLNGKPIKVKEIANNGNGSVIINESELDTGMYLYSLIVDGTEIDTKRMILTD